MRLLTKIVVGAMLSLPGLAVAEEPTNLVASRSEILHPSQYGEAKPAKFPSSNKPNAHVGDFTIVPRTFSNPQAEAVHTRHINAPDGSPTPLGCGTFYTEFKFVFGSCRQYFGTGDSAPGTFLTPFNRATRQP